MKKNRIIKALTVTLLVLTMMMPSMSFANNGNAYGKYKDVKKTDWFYEAVELMSSYGIIDGYSDGSFKPNEPVKRNEFAKLMVNTLKIDTPKVKSTFGDLADKDWATKYIQAAKPYLTGYKTTDGVINFKPTNSAVREDMAVALVKALKYEPATDLTVLNKFKDSNLISEQLKPYVAAAVIKGLMEGSEEEGGVYFNPVHSIKRSEAAELLMKVIKEEKIVFDEVKIVMNDDEDDDDDDDDVSNRKPKVEVELDGDYVKVSWDEINKVGLKGYKIVASRSNSNPVYPADGYMKWETNLSNRDYKFSAKNSYSGGDVGKFTPGDVYYVSVTAYYNDGKVAGNAVKITMPGTVTAPVAYITPELKYEIDGDDVVLRWTEINHPNFNGYKVVASKSDETPIYPTNGYKTYITDKDDNNYEINAGDSYNNGDFNEFDANEEYYISITAVYSDRKIPSNTIKVKIPVND